MNGLSKPLRLKRAHTLVGAAVSGLAVAAPLMIGGVHPMTQVALSAATMMVAGVFAWQHRGEALRAVPFAGAAVLATAATFVQLVPLPAAVLAALSPLAYQLHHETSPSSAWMTITLDAPATWLALVRCVACLALLVMTAVLVQSRGWTRRLLSVIAAVGVGLAILGFAQRIWSTDMILGFYRPHSIPGFGVFGTFVDVNHAASVLALGGLVAAGLAVDSFGGTRIAYAAGSFACAAALVYSTSRGGLIGYAIGGFVLAVILAGRVVGVPRAIVSAALLLTLAVGVALLTSDGLRARMLTGGDRVWDTQKTRGWGAGGRLMGAYAWTGVGRGAFEAPVNAFRRTDDGVRLVYPENILIELGSEWGVPVTLALLALLGTTAVRIAPTVAKLPPPVVAAACGVIAVVAHDFADFGLETLGVAFPTVVALGVVAGRALGARRRPGAEESQPFPAAIALGLFACWASSIGAAAWSARHTLSADYDALQAAAAHGPVDAVALEAAIARHPADDYLELLAAQRTMRSDAGEAMHHLNRALWLHPANGQAHRLAARLLASHGRPAQAAIEYRLAAQAGLDVPVEELVRVLGGNTVDAAAQDAESLIAFGRRLYEGGRPIEADLVLQRACEAASAPEPALRTRVQLALQYAATGQLPAAARDLLEAATADESFGTAAEGFARAGDLRAADRAIEADHRAHPSEGALFVLAARLHLAAGDLQGGRAMLMRGDNLSLSLADRREAADLMANIAEKSGDEETAIAARARARLIARQLRDMNASLGHDGLP